MRNLTLLHYFLKPPTIYTSHKDINEARALNVSMCSVHSPITAVTHTHVYIYIYTYELDIYVF